MQIQTMSVMSRDQLPNVLYRLKSDQIHSQVHGGGGGGGGGRGLHAGEKIIIRLSFFVFFYFIFLLSQIYSSGWKKNKLKLSRFEVSLMILLQPCPFVCQWCQRDLMSTNYDGNLYGKMSCLQDLACYLSVPFQYFLP